MYHYLVEFLRGLPKMHGRFPIGLPKVHGQFRMDPPKWSLRFRIGFPLNLLPLDIHSR